MRNYHVRPEEVNLRDFTPRQRQIISEGKATPRMIDWWREEKRRKTAKNHVYAGGEKRALSADSLGAEEWL